MRFFWWVIVAPTVLGLLAYVLTPGSRPRRVVSMTAFSLVATVVALIWVAAT